MAVSCAICFGDRVAVAPSVAVSERAASAVWLGEGRYPCLEFVNTVDLLSCSFDSSMLEKGDMHILRGHCVKGMMS